MQYAQCPELPQHQNQVKRKLLQIPVFLGITVSWHSCGCSFNAHPNCRPSRSLIHQTVGPPPPPTNRTICPSTLQKLPWNSLRASPRLWPGLQYPKIPIQSRIHGMWKNKPDVWMPRPHKPKGLKCEPMTPLGHPQRFCVPLWWLRSVHERDLLSSGHVVVIMWLIGIWIPLLKMWGKKQTNK